MSHNTRTIMVPQERVVVVCDGCQQESEPIAFFDWAHSPQGWMILVGSDVDGPPTLCSWSCIETFAKRQAAVQVG